jgi:hypothetical protein
MKKIGFVILIQITCLMGFSQTPPWKEGGISIPASTNLDVRWQAADHFPRKVWIYQLLPNDFSPEIISNTMTLCSFAEKDKIEQDTNGISFKNGARTLSISFSSGSIRYGTPEPQYVLKPNSFEGVPKTEDMPELTENFLHKVGIKLSEIQKGTNGAPMFYFSDRGYEFLFNHVLTTDTWARIVFFRRSVDGAEVVGNSDKIQFGERGQISQIDLSWPKLKAIKSYRTISQKGVINFLRDGNAAHGPTADNAPDIDWPTIKSVTITKAIPSYLVDGMRLYPYLHLDATIDTGHGTAVVAILCPIIDETKL